MYEVVFFSGDAAVWQGRTHGPKRHVVEHARHDGRVLFASSFTVWYLDTYGQRRRLVAAEAIG
jgi:hypothetical protein